MATPKTIKVKNFSDVNEEYTATAVAIMPGTLVELTSSGTVQAHSTAGGNVLPMFAFEDELQGKGIDDTYLASDKIQVWIPGRGDIVYAIVADGNDIAIGDFLESNGSGYLQEHTPDVWVSSAAPTVTNQIVGQAIEAVDTLQSSSEAESSAAPLALARRIKIRLV
jgi:hypothetical protein